MHNGEKLSQSKYCEKYFNLTICIHTEIIKNKVLYLNSYLFVQYPKISAILLKSKI